MNIDVEKYWKAYCNGDKKAFENVFIFLFDPLFFMMMPLTKDRDVAKDIVQEALIKLYEYKNPSSIADIRRWTFTVAKNLYRDEQRKNKTRSNYRQRVIKENTGNLSSPAHFADKDNIMKLAKKHLSPRDFQILKMDMDGYSTAEIAQSFDIEEKTASNLKSKIKKTMEKVLAHSYVLLILFCL